MSWPRDLIQIPTLLLEVVSLLREQNSLHRELIMALTGRMSSTALTTPSAIFVPPKLSRTYTAQDVSVVTREMREEQQIVELQRARAPWHADTPAPGATADPSSSDVDAAPTASPASPAPNPANPSPPLP